jgi:hypothetical protein
MAKTTRPEVMIYDIETGKAITRSMTDQEFAQYKLDSKKVADIQVAEAAKSAAKAALLERLGITAEEASLLLS